MNEERNRGKMLNSEDIIGTLSRNKEFLQKKFGVMAIYLYGSFATGGAMESHDVDILVDIPRKFKKFKNYLDLKRFLKSNLYREVDVVYMDSINPEIEEEIQNEKIKIE